MLLPAGKNIGFDGSLQTLTARKPLSRRGLRAFLYALFRYAAPPHNSKFAVLQLIF